MFRHIARSSLKASNLSFASIIAQRAFSQTSIRATASFVQQGKKVRPWRPATRPL